MNVAAPCTQGGEGGDSVLHQNWGPLAGVAKHRGSRGDPLYCQGIAWGGAKRDPPQPGETHLGAP